ncbi:MAG TPA: translation initiation factor IF-2 [Firmicutes bacterium]|nr:translation initiation factor IF-2 [Bacillota bacterium]HBL48686.1 translation initiation factor IF-2 [Bacillota bacterium]HCF89355.1 translation initiation factor IF-2 [Bacillota bacterium]HCX71692.1 translation initiation factor IF-2 [Bacillota bacterium]
MTKKRVFELSKELDIPSKEIVQFLQEFGADVKNHMSTVEDHVAAIVKRKFRPDQEPPVKAPEPEKKPAASKASIAPALTAADAGKKQPIPASQDRNSNVPERRPATSGQPGMRSDARPPVRSDARTPVRPDARTEARRETRPTTDNRGGGGVSGRPAAQTPTGSPAPRQGSAAPRPQQQQQWNGPRQNKEVQRPGTPPPSGTIPPQAGGAPAARQSAPPGQGGRAPQNRPGQPGQQRREPSSAPAQNQQSQHHHRPDSRPVNRPDSRPDNRTSGKPGEVRRSQAPPSNRPGGRPAPAAAGGQRPNNAAQRGGGFRRQRPTGQRGGGGVRKPVQSNVEKLMIGPVISVKDLAAAMELAASEVIKKLMAMGVMSSINQDIDFETAQIIGNEFGVEVVPEGPTLEEQTLEEIEDSEEDVMPRSPVVTVMGHVDHGKTSLLDRIRETHVTSQEAGGITQHIGAYQVEVRSKRITFLDTPGHEAFTAMRARGAQITDIVILVVAADDGVMPQTVEAINHVKAAQIPMIVAINKIDKPDANPDRVKQELTEYGLVAEEWGGDSIMVPVSAATGEGIDNLLEMVLLVSEMQDLKANPNRSAIGTVIEAKLDKGRGPVATVLIQKGTLFVGDVILVGSVFGRVRLLNNDKGKRVKKAGPSAPVEVVGLAELPEAGDTLYAVDDEKVARQLAESRSQKKRETELHQSSRVSLEDLFSKIQGGELKDLNIVIKADVRGSIEALEPSLNRLENEEVRVNVIHSGVGAVTETDVMLAAASNAIIIAFNVRPDPMAKRTAEKETVDIRMYRVIYDAINDVRAALEGMLTPEFKETVIGKAEVRQTFRVPKIGLIAGSYVTEGRILRTADVRVLRDNVVMHEGKIDSLRRFKDDAREVAQGYECGIGLEKFQDIKEGDVIEAFIMEEVKR